jgi:hypothetical protein
MTERCEEMGESNGGCDQEATRAFEVERARKFEAVFDSIQDAILVFGKTGGPVRLNKAARQQFEALAKIQNELGSPPPLHLGWPRSPALRSTLATRPAG